MSVLLEFDVLEFESKPVVLETSLLLEFVSEAKSTVGSTLGSTVASGEGEGSGSTA